MLCFCGYGLQILAIYITIDQRSFKLFLDILLFYEILDLISSLFVMSLFYNLLIKVKI